MVSAATGDKGSSSGSARVTPTNAFEDPYTVAVLITMAQAARGLVSKQVAAGRSTLSLEMRPNIGDDRDGTNAPDKKKTTPSKTALAIDKYLEQLEKVGPASCIPNLGLS